MHNLYYSSQVKFSPVANTMFELKSIFSFFKLFKKSRPLDRVCQNAPQCAANGWELPREDERIRSRAASIFIIFIIIHALGSDVHNTSRKKNKNISLI